MHGDKIKIDTECSQQQVMASGFDWWLLFAPSACICVYLRLNELDSKF
jgi:hypothetical protein